MTEASAATVAYVIGNAAYIIGALVLCAAIITAVVYMLRHRDSASVQSLEPPEVQTTKENHEHS
ncbi:hypothetical protein I6E29_01055 [Arcanobacterium haemolyticum]|nr:hypothetical protein [Arcanobacterium haemolyticum]